MSFYDTLRKNLTPELLTQVTDQLGDDFDFDLVPRSRLNKVIKQRNALRDQFSEISQPRGRAGASDEDDFDEGTTDNGQNKGREPAPPTPDIEALKSQLQKEKDDAVKGVKIQYAALEKLRSANAIDPELIWQAGLLNSFQLDLDKDGKTVTGLDEAIAELKKSHASQFGNVSADVPGGTGKSGGDDGFGGVKTKEDFLKLPTDKQIAFKAAHPELFKSFLNA